MGDSVQESKAIRIRFPEETNELPLPYVNALVVQSGVDDFFITVGSLTPPEIKTEEELEKISELTAKPLFRFATSRENIRRFIDVLQQQYNNQAQAINDEE
jgi:hypothetical protein